MGARGLPLAGYSPVRDPRHQDRTGPGPRPPNAPAPPGAARRPEASRAPASSAPRSGSGKSVPWSAPPGSVPNGRPAPCPTASGSRRTSCWAEMPSRRTPRPTSSDRSRSRATRPMSAARSVGAAQRAGAGDGLEVAEAHLELDGPGGGVCGPEARRHPVGQADELVLERGVVVEVGREGLLVADRLHLLVGDDRPLVAVPGEGVEVVTRGVAERCARACPRGWRRGRRRSRRRAWRGGARSPGPRPRGGAPAAGAARRARCPAPPRGDRRAWRDRWPAWRAAWWWRRPPRW